MKRLGERVAIVTGGAGGIGSATVARLIAEGASVAVADIDEARARDVAAQHPGKAIAIGFDARDHDAVRGMIEDTVRHFGRLDILDNNHFLGSERAATEDTTVVDTPFDVWNDIMAVNATSFFATCKFAVPHMLAGGGGAIINIATGSALAGEGRRIAYGSSKAAVVTLGKYIATQYGKRGIRCNTIAPGVILTETVLRAAPEVVALMSRHVLTPRLGEPEDIAALVAFLASDESGFINGQLISCDGGLLVHVPHVAEIEDMERAQQG